MKLFNPNHPLALKFLCLFVGFLDITFIIGGFSSSPALAFTLSLIANAAWVFYLDQIGYLQFFGSRKDAEY